MRHVSALFRVPAGPAGDDRHSGSMTVSVKHLAGGAQQFSVDGRAPPADGASHRMALLRGTLLDRRRVAKPGALAKDAPGVGERGLDRRRAGIRYLLPALG